MVTFNSARLPRSGSAAPAGRTRPSGPTLSPRIPASAYRHSSPAPRTPRPRSRATSPIIRTWLLGLAALGIGLAPGCESSAPHSLSGGARPAPGRSDTVPASRAWRDLDAAVSAACTACELAVLKVETPAPGVRRYQLLAITDAKGVLTATAPPGYIDGDSPIARVVPVSETRLDCSIEGADPSGRDADREACFLRAVRDWRPSHSR